MNSASVSRPYSLKNTVVTLQDGKRQYGQLKQELELQDSLKKLLMVSIASIYMESIYGPKVSPLDILQNFPASFEELGARFTANALATQMRETAESSQVIDYIEPHIDEAAELLASTIQSFVKERTQNQQASAAR